MIKHYYFAYGSNISTTRIRAKDRCPNAEFVCIAYLDDHELCFPQHNGNDHLVAGYRYSLGKKLWGVVYLISDNELDGLYGAEGYRPKRETKYNSYEKIEGIKLFDKNDKKLEFNVFIFKQNRENTQSPEDKAHSNEYLNHIISGYEEFMLYEHAEVMYEVLKKLVS